MHEKDLKKFILEASRATYASGDESIKKKEFDRSTTITFSAGRYKMHDNYFGGEPYGGREVVFLENKPIWMMVYYGFVHTNFEAKEVYPFLIEALSNSTEDMPYRGPKLFDKGNLRYENILEGELPSFSGTEKIYKDSACVYEARYIGGFVDF
ncbi:MAG: DUF5680 domain-containing protein [Candidatus Nomurabacteria bacterium]|nr:DUF5680 domain-containing protein [Candidatus Nomurabacteria bacterium]